jgi:hypothetical protein
MGFFSWKTQDTNKSIANTFSCKPTFKVVMKDNKGNEWVEEDYEGYGVFGGKDYYQLLAEMNNAEGLTGDVDNDRLIGIRLSYGVSAIENKKTGQIYRANGIDFFNWGSEIIHDGKSANELLDSGEWVSINIKEKGIVFPNLVEDESREWVDDEPEDCEAQGYFYYEEEVY